MRTHREETPKYKFKTDVTMPSLSPPITPEQLHVWFHAVQMDVVKAFRLLSSGNITSAALVSHEMKTLYTLVALLVVLTVKPIRSAAWKTIDTLIALADAICDNWASLQPQLEQIENTAYSYFNSVEEVKLFAAVLRAVVHSLKQTAWDVACACSTRTIAALEASLPEVAKQGLEELVCGSEVISETTKKAVELTSSAAAKQFKKDFKAVFAVKDIPERMKTIMVVVALPWTHLVAGSGD